jgi:putative ABC transport system permease protein
MADSSPDDGEASASDPPGSRLSIADQLAEAASTLIERPFRTMLSGVLVAVSAALIVVVTALGTTASQQISSRFDAMRATLVSVNVVGPDTEGEAVGPSEVGSADVPDLLIERFPSDPQSRLARLQNVVASGALLRRTRTAEVALAPEVMASETADPDIDQGEDLYLSDSGYARAARPTVEGRWISASDEEHDRQVVVIGRVTADRLGITRPRGDLLIDGVPHGVIGIITSSRASPQLLDGVVIARSDNQIEAGWEVDDSSGVLIRTLPGAARTIAGQAPRQLSPEDPSMFSASAPPDPDEFRETLEGDSKEIMRSFSGVAIVLGVVTASLVSLSTINSRKGAIGLLIAMGATRPHVFRLIVTECSLAGLVAGVVGTAIGLLVVSAVCISRDWQLVLSPGLPPAAIVGTGVAGVVAGLLPAWAAARVDPVESLRSA